MSESVGSGGTEIGRALAEIAGVGVRRPGDDHDGGGVVRRGCRGAETRQPRRNRRSRRPIPDTAASIV